MLYKICKLTCRYYFRLFHGMRVYGLENIPSGGCLLAPNHVSFYDPPLVGCALRESVYFMARKNLYDSALFGPLIQRLNTIPVDLERPGLGALRSVIRLAKEGNKVVLFPEGSRAFDGALQPAQAGIGLAVARAGVPVVPARVFGAFECWPRSRNRPKLFKRIRVVYGPSLRFDAENFSDRSDYQWIGDKIMEAIRSIGDPSL